MTGIHHHGSPQSSAQGAFPLQCCYLCKGSLHHLLQQSHWQTFSGFEIQCLIGKNLRCILNQAQ